MNRFGKTMEFKTR